MGCTHVASPASASVRRVRSSTNRSATGLSMSLIRSGPAAEAVVTVTNKSGEAVPTPIAIVGIPGGLEVRHDQLKELVKQQKIAAYEVIGREVVLYWRGLEANARVEIPLSLTAAIGGSFTAPASRAYLYYTDEHKHWAAPLSSLMRSCSRWSGGPRSPPPTGA